MNADDILEAIDGVVLGNTLSQCDLVWFYILLSDHFARHEDDLMSLHFLNSARDSMNGAAEAFSKEMIKRYLTLGRPDEAFDLALPLAFSGWAAGITEIEMQAMLNFYRNTRKAAQAKAEHGHQLLLAYLSERWDQLIPQIGERKPILVEVGSTRENIPGQGSTGKIAEFCKNRGIHFITVDMDPHNTRMATRLFSRLQTDFEAVTMKGEDYLRRYSGPLDFVFLDAYDFDHGRHSALRQSRYRKYMGEAIDDVQCHVMHLDCAQSVAERLAPHGLVCIDDTWIDNGHWAAKGTLAMPFLLGNGFRLLNAWNRAALLGRTDPD